MSKIFHAGGRKDTVTGGGVPYKQYNPGVQEARGTAGTLSTPHSCLRGTVADIYYSLNYSTARQYKHCAVMYLFQWDFGFALSVGRP